jgi:integration host factor subunit beta
VKVAERCRRHAGIVTKADLIAVIADKLKFPWARAELLVDVVFDCMEQSMSRGEKIEIRGSGSFTVRQYRAYDGRNPRTGAVVPVKPKRLAFFKVGKEMRAHPGARGGQAGSRAANRNTCPLFSPLLLPARRLKADVDAAHAGCAYM